MGTLRRLLLILTVVAVVALGAGCESPDLENSADRGTFPYIGEEPPPVPPIDLQGAERGERLYASTCAACHGTDLSGADDWKTPNPDGTFKPPPMDSSGHTWHHSDQLLTDIITNGSTAPGSAMVGFRDLLSGDDIGDVIAYLKSSWGADERFFQWAVTWQESEREATEPRS